MKERITDRQPLQQSPRAAKLKKELDSLKAELKRARGAGKRLMLNDEIRSVAAELAKYMN